LTDLGIVTGHGFLSSHLTAIFTFRGFSFGSIFFWAHLDTTLHFVHHAFRSEALLYLQTYTKCDSNEIAFTDVGKYSTIQTMLGDMQ
jgi:hypothetical protein